VCGFQSILGAKELIQDCLVEEEVKGDVDALVLSIQGGQESVDGGETTGVL
jgi:hypothetical protein